MLVTEHQTAGRGRQQRAWHDEPGNSLLVSFLVRPRREHAPLMPLLTGVAAVEALAHLGGAEPTEGLAGLKWPNDVLAPTLGERKLAGILAESATAVGKAIPEGVAPDRLIVVAGMGLNLRWSTPPPEEIRIRAATVNELLSTEVDRHEVLDLFLRYVERWLRRLEAEGSNILLDQYRKHCLTLGRQVRFSTSTAEYSGLAAEISKTGTLILNTEVHGRVELNSGDAHHQP